MAAMAIPLMVLGIAAIMIVCELLYPGCSWPQVGGWHRLRHASGFFWRWLQEQRLGEMLRGVDVGRR